jgi:hypothetical protein
MRVEHLLFIGGTYIIREHTNIYTIFINTCKNNAINKYKSLYY